MSAGDEFRESFTQLYEDPDLLYATLLDQACATLDLIEALEDDVRAVGLMVEGSKHQSVINPAVAELRQQRAALGKLLKELDLAEPQTSRSRAGKDLARARWGGG
jgi:hypothetical protein